MIVKDFLERGLDPVRWRMRKYPKAAKKQRIVKKWRNRFGPDFRDILAEEMLRFDEDALFVGRTGDSYVQVVNFRAPI